MNIKELFGGNGNEAAKRERLAKEQEIDEMPVAEDWPESPDWVCAETKEPGRMNPKNKSIIGCLIHNFWTVRPGEGEKHFIKKESQEPPA